jgi:hypothetical protein
LKNHALIAASHPSSRAYLPPFLRLEPRDPLFLDDAGRNLHRKPELDLIVVTRPWVLLLIHPLHVSYMYQYEGPKIIVQNFFFT